MLLACPTRCQGFRAAKSFPFRPVFRCGTIRAMSQNQAQPDPAQQVQDLQVILGVAQALAGTQSLPELVALILDSARRVLHADRSTLFRYDPATHELYARVGGGETEVRFPADRGLAGAAAQSRRIINVPD